MLLHKLKGFMPLISTVNHRKEPKMIIIMIIAFFVLLVVSFNAVAGELTYTCKILNVCELAGYGSLKHSDLEK
jgi:hypothetical protein